MKWFPELPGEWKGLLLFVIGTTAAAALRAQCTAGAGSDQQICAGVMIILNGSGSGEPPLNYSWSGSSYITNTNSAQASFNFPPPVTNSQSIVLELTVTDANGCVATDQVTITLQPTPLAVLAADPPAVTSSFNGLTTFSVCDPASNWTFNFSDQSVSSGASSFSIDWGDGSAPFTPSQGWSTSHAYDPGLYTITYSIENANGCSQSTDHQVFLGTNPGGGISTDPNTNICAGTTLPFYINSVGSNSPGTTYVISFGDGEQITLDHPPPAVVYHEYNASSCGATGGQYFVQFVAQNPCDQTQGQIGPIRVSDPAVAAFSVSPNDTACINTTITFSDQSTGAMAPACNAPSRVWSISPATGWNATGLGSFNGAPTNPSLWIPGSASLGVTFSLAGTYVIEITSGNSCGISTEQHTVCIEEPPVAGIDVSPQTGCAPLLVSTTNNTAINGCDMDWQWNATGTSAICGGMLAWYFPTGSSAGSFEPQVQITAPGTYQLELQAINSCGVFSQAESVTVNAAPQVDLAGITNICAGECLDPIATTADCGAPITSYSWNFPGGSPSASDQSDPGSICYSAATNSAVSITVANACGQATDVVNLQVGAAPGVPSVTSNSPICMGQTLSVSAVPIAGMSYAWSGPNNFSSSQAAFTISNVNASHAGTYTLITSSGGCMGTPQSVQVQVVPAPVITISPSPVSICAGESVTLTVNGAGNYQWYIGNSLVHSGSSFTATPAATTTYTVNGSGGNCQGSATVTVNVHQLPVVDAGPDQTFCDQAIGVQLTGSPVGGTWSGTNVTSGGTFTPVPGDLGVFPITYAYTDQYGCSNSDVVDITVEALTLIADAGADTSICQGGTAVLLVASPQGGTWIGAGAGGMFVPSAPGPQVLTYEYGTGTCTTSDQLTVEVLPAPVLSMPNEINVCAANDPIELIAGPIGGSWTGEGISDQPWSFDPSVVAIGDHELIYTFTDGSGCTSVGSINATVNAMPVVDAGSDQQLCDQPVPVQLGATPAGGIWSASWMDVTPDGELTPDGLGSDQLIYTFTSDQGCTSSDTIEVEVVPVDQPAFAGSDTSVCINTGVLQLTGSPAGGSWSGNSITADGTFTPAIAGDHVLTYSFGSSTCLVSDQVTITVYALPIVDAGNDVGVCADAGPQQLSASPIGGIWSGTGIDASGIFDPMSAIGGGNPVNYSYIDPLTGCANDDDAIVTVHDLPEAAFVHDPIACVNAPFQFSNSSSGALSAEWDFGGDGTSFQSDPLHTFSTEGTFTVMLVASTGNGCTDTTYSDVTVWDVPQAEFDLDIDQGCGPLAVEFTNSSMGEGMDHAWDLGGLGNPVAEQPGMFIFPADPADTAYYTITLEVTNVCGSSSVSDQVIVLPSPTAIFAPDQDTYCSFAEVSFGNASIGLPDQFQWDLGDGSTSTSADAIVTNTYLVGSDPEDFTITLIASNTCGSDTTQQTITVLPNDVTAFFNTAPVAGCAPLTVEFTQYSTGDTTFFWDFGDGDVGIEHDPAHVFDQPGLYSIELHAFGCGYDSYMIDVEVFPSPDPTFTISPAQACAGEEITFSNTTIDVASVHWDFGDGSGSDQAAVEHTYAQPGTYDVQLTVASILNGCEASDVQQVTIDVTPMVSFTTAPGSGCIDLDVTFTNNTIDGDVFQWWFGDGNTSVSPSPFHTYSTAGQFEVTLVASTIEGCSDTTTSIVVAHPLPTSSFQLSAYESCISPVEVQTINNSIGALGYEWSFGDDQSTLVQPLIGSEEPGTYDISLVAMNEFGCTDTSSQQFTVHPTPEAYFEISSVPGCAGHPIGFANASINSSSYEWWFGDGSSSSDDQPLHTYGSAGTFDVTLIATGDGDCTDTLRIDGAAIINPSPIADFDHDTLSSLRNAIRFINHSEGAISFEWHLGDGETTTEMHPIHIFPADGGAFHVCLVAVNEFTCTDTLCRTVLVESDPVIHVPNTFTPNDDGLNDVLFPVLNGFSGWDYRFSVFDRWGKEIYRTNDRGAGWNGRLNGADAPIDVYVWQVVLERDGDARDFLGHVSLLR